MLEDGSIEFPFEEGMEEYTEIYEAVKELLNPAKKLTWKEFENHPFIQKCLKIYRTEKNKKKSLIDNFKETMN